MAYLAHSARPDKGIPAQEYGEHIRASRDDARRYAKECGRYSQLYNETLIATATLAGEFHDLGKLDALIHRHQASLKPTNSNSSGVLRFLVRRTRIMATRRVIMGTRR